jgi:hypothetical protein
MEHRGHMNCDCHFGRDAICGRDAVCGHDGHFGHDCGGHGHGHCGPMFGADILYENLRRRIHESLWHCLCDYCRPHCFDPCHGPKYVAGCCDPYAGYFVSACGCRCR